MHVNGGPQAPQEMLLYFRGICDTLGSSPANAPQACLLC